VTKLLLAVTRFSPAAAATWPVVAAVRAARKEALEWLATCSSR
jgi:hypothetical protein